MSDMRIPGIYQIVNRINRKRYVGQAINIAKRWRDHVRDLTSGNHRSRKLLRAWNKYGADYFNFEIIERVDDASLRNEREQFWIDAYRSASHAGYNICPTSGTSLGVQRTAETRAKQSARAKARLADPAFRKRMNDNQRGWHHTAETRLRMSLVRKGRRHSLEHAAAIKAARSTPEAKAKVSSFHKGRPKPKRYRP